MLKPIAIATAVAGTLDILFAMILTVLFGREIGNMLRYVGSGPFPQATEMGTGGAILGLARPLRADGDHGGRLCPRCAAHARAHRKPIQSGVLYGLATYVVMNWLVVPMRFGTPLPPSPCRSRRNCSRTSCWSAFPSP